jgi:hypothetical protein
VINCIFMIAAASILFLMYSILVLIVGVRVSKLHRDGIYKSSSRPSLKLLRKTLLEAKTNSSKIYVQNTLLLFQIGFIVLITFLVVIFVWIFI